MAIERTNFAAAGCLRLNRTLRSQLLSPVISGKPWSETEGEPVLRLPASRVKAFVAMIDVIKKTLLAGVGAAVITKEKVESALGDFVQQGKVSSAEARAMAEKIADQGRQEFETMSHELNEKLRDGFTRTDRSAQHRIDALEKRVALLEKFAGLEIASTTPSVSAAPNVSAPNPPSSPDSPAA